MKHAYWIIAASLASSGCSRTSHSLNCPLFSTARPRVPKGRGVVCEEFDLGPVFGSWPNASSRI